MRLSKILSSFLVLIVIFTGCELLEPELQNIDTIDRVYEDPEFAEGLLIRAYAYIPTNDYNWDEVATDDAVSNDPFNAYMRMATGEWSAIFNPQNIWNNSNSAILHINHFLEVVDSVPFKWTNDTINDLYVRRLSGEAYALRGLFKYFLLRNHGGVGANGQLLGTPEYNEFIRDQEEFFRPRPDFTQSVISAYADISLALDLLPMDYGNISDLEELPAGFSEVPSVNVYNDVFGDFTQQRITGRIARGIRAKLALLAASPAFNPDNSMDLWQDAAEYTGELLDENGGISGIDEKGHIFYLKEQVDESNLTTGDNQDIAEVLWRRPYYDNRTREQNNFPPSVYGNGRINPTQNLVDAFPMENGYPITHPSSGYDPDDPYANRDPRLSLYIVYDGSTVRNETINTGPGTGDDGLEAMENSTRTGYYLRKMLREDVNLNPSSPSNQRHFNIHIRYTELYLNYAEAANEAWGPDGTGTFGFSARDVIAALRERAGIEQPDNYLMSIAGKDEMRELIRNERRLELCFESQRFWDMRRWKEDLTEPARGVRISDGTYTVFDVEQRRYNNEYMHYGPIPYNEIVKFDFVQNQGW
ncbi:MAG: RagB/SusD family nutrient uptake outer membrane protein [bacterium]